MHYLDIVGFIEMHRYYYANWDVCEYVELLKIQKIYKNTMVEFRAIKNANPDLYWHEIVEIYEISLKYKNWGFDLTKRQVIEIQKEWKSGNFKNENDLIKYLLKTRLKKCEWMNRWYNQIFS